MAQKKLNRELKLGSTILILYALWAIVWIIYKYIFKGNLQIPYEPSLNLENELAAPLTHGLILGADLMGKSLLESLSAGLTYSLSLAFIVTMCTSTIGLLIGYLSVKLPRGFNMIFDMLINLVFVFPSILIAIMIMSVVGQSVLGLIFALIITGWPTYAKVSRIETKRLLNLNYVEGARALGMSEWRLFYKVIVPGIIPILIVNMVLGISGVIISESALGFLGLGASPYSWGTMLSNAKTVLLEAPHVAIILSLCMAGLIIGLNLFGDGLRDFLDPKQSEE